jgi:hypothetical protein
MPDSPEEKKAEYHARKNALLRKNNFPPGYQVLCMNCNFGKRYSMICPHQTQEKTNALAA